MTTSENCSCNEKIRGAISNSEISPTIENIIDISPENILRAWEARKDGSSGGIVEHKPVQDDGQELVEKAEKAIRMAADVMMTKHEFKSSWEIAVHIMSLVNLGNEKDIQIIKEWASQLKDVRMRNHEGLWFSGYDQESKTSNVYDTSFAIVALLKAGEDSNLEIIKKGIDFIQRMNDLTYGGWPAKKYEEMDVGATSWAIIALAKVSYSNPSIIQRGIDWLKFNQHHDGGWGQHYYDVNSVAVFSWDKIPGKDNERLIEFLTKNCVIDWARNAKIEKIDGDKTIKVSIEKKSLSLKLSDEKNEVVLEIEGLIAKMRNGELNIYNKGRPSLIAKTSDAVAALLESRESPNKSPEIKDAMQWMIERQSIQKDEKIDEWVWSWGKNENIVAHDVENTSCAIITLLKCAKDMDLSSADLSIKLAKLSIEWLLQRQNTDGTWEDNENWGSSITPRVVSSLNCFCRTMKEMTK